MVSRTLARASRPAARGEHAVALRVSRMLLHEAQDVLVVVHGEDGLHLLHRGHARGGGQGHGRGVHAERRAGQGLEDRPLLLLAAAPRGWAAGGAGRAAAAARRAEVPRSASALLDVGR